MLVEAVGPVWFSLTHNLPREVQLPRSRSIYQSSFPALFLPLQSYLLAMKKTCNSIHRPYLVMIYEEVEDTNLLGASGDRYQYPPSSRFE